MDRRKSHCSRADNNARVSRTDFNQVSVMMAKNTIFEILILGLFAFNSILIFLISLCFKRYETEKSAARLYKEMNREE